MDNKENILQNKTLLSVIAVALVSFSGIMAETSMNVTFTTMTKVFSTGFDNVQWITTAYLLSVTLMITTSAFLVKKYSIRTLWLTSLAIFTIGTLLGGFSDTLSILIIGRSLEGIAAGIAMPLSFNIIIYTIPKNKVGIWMGISAMIVSLAPSFGPTYGGFILAILGWRAIFFILMVFPVISFLVGWRALSQFNPIEKDIHFDFIAFILLGLDLTLILILTNQISNRNFNPMWWLLVFIITILFILKVKTSTKKFINFDLFKQFRFMALFIPIILYMFSMLGLNLIIPTFSENVLHENTFISGFVLLPGALMGAFLNPLFGRLYDSRGAKFSLYLGNLIFTLIILIMMFTIDKFNILSLIICYVIFIIGRNLAFTSAQTQAIYEQPVINQADATGIIQTFQMFMGALGTTVGSLFKSSYGFINGFQYFTVLSLLIAIINGGLIYLYCKRQK